MKQEKELTKRAKKFVNLCIDKELKYYASEWVIFQYKVKELQDFLDTIREYKELPKDMESDMCLYSGVKGNNTRELELELKQMLIEEYL